MNMVIKNSNILLLILVLAMTVLLFRQCDIADKAKSESTRIGNNWKASQDSVRNFRDKNGNYAAEIRALTLTLEEAKKKLEFEKNKPPVTVIKYETRIVEKIVEVPVITMDTVIGRYASAAIVLSNVRWGKSSRSIRAVIPYAFVEGMPEFGNASINLEQNIYLTASLVRDKKTKEVFVNLATDYPGTKFNDLEGILIDQKTSGFKDLARQQRKSFGLGFHVGMGIGGTNVVPYVGVGLNYTPRLLQW